MLKDLKLQDETAVSDDEEFPEFPEDEETAEDEVAE